MSRNHFPHVYQPLDIGTMHMKNRIQFSPIVSNHAGYITGSVGPEMFEFFSTQAKTGCALVTVGSTPVDFEEGRDFFGCLSATSDHDIAGLAHVTREIHRLDCNFSAELTHGGQWAAPLLPEGQRAFVPSIFGDMDPNKFIEIGRAEMDKVIDNHVKAIRRCMQAHFDMIMVHLAHGNLASAFLSPAWNYRTDNYGGSFENRVRFPLELLEACYAETAGKIPIEIRFVGNEWIDRGMPLDERIEFLKLAEPYIDMVVVSGGTLMQNQVVHKNMPGYYTEAGVNVEYAAAYKEACPDLVISVCGGISTLDEAEEIIASGKADVIAMAKALMADPDYVNKGERGEEKEIRPCMRCMYCMRNITEMGHLEGCAVNPVFGWEYRGTTLIPIVDAGKALVVGGGPAGMEAARDLRKRGFEVVLYEKNEELGGRLPEATSLYLKEGFRRYFEWTVRKTKECGAKIVLGTEVTPEVIAAENPDIVILATGAELIRPKIPGIDGASVVDVVSVDRGEAQVGKKVVVCGAGLSGAECALQLAVDGHEVTLVDMVPEEEFYKDMIFFMYAALTQKLDEYGVVRRGSCAVKEFTPEGVVVVNAEGTEELLEADTAVTAFGIKADAGKIEELRDVVAKTFVVGDAHKVGVIGDAINAAYWAVRDL